MPNFPDDVFDEQRRAAEAAFLEARARHERLIEAFGKHLTPEAKQVSETRVEEIPGRVLQLQRR